MLIIYEKAENYFEKLKNIVDKNATRLFVSRIRNIDESGVITPTILIQAIIGDDVYTYRYTEELPKFQIVPQSSFAMVGSEALKESALKSYNDSFISFGRKTEDEYQRIIAILRNMGFISIENAMIP